MNASRPAAGEVATHDSLPCRVLSRSLRQLFAGLLARHVLGVPVRPILVALPPGALLVLAVGGLGTPKCARQIRRGCECRLSGVDPAGQPRRDLLQQPAVSVRITERSE